jgi:hypothetical protein
MEIKVKVLADTTIDVPEVIVQNDKDGMATENYINGIIKSLFPNNVKVQKFEYDEPVKENKKLEILPLTYVHPLFNPDTMDPKAKEDILPNNTMIATVILNEKDRADIFMNPDKNLVDIDHIIPLSISNDDKFNVYTVREGYNLDDINAKDFYRFATAEEEQLILRAGQFWLDEHKDEFSKENEDVEMDR